MPLTDTAIRAAKPRTKPYKLADAAGLYLHCQPTGARYWRLKYRFAGREKLLAIGVYPEVGLAEARKRRDDARAKLRDGVDPSFAKREQRRELATRARNSFESVAREWVDARRAQWRSGHAERILGSLHADIFPRLGYRPITEITTGELLDCLRLIERRGALDIASRVAQRCSAVFRYAIQTNRAKSNPAADLRGALKTRKVQHRAALKHTEIGEFLGHLKGYEGRPETRIGLRLLMLTFVRTSELREAPWSEFDLKASEWRIPAERMKMREAHIVPLSKQAVAALEELHALTGWGTLAFPSVSDPRKPMSENTLLYALYRMGYHGRATGHGFRSLASTCLNELGYRPDVIERQLAHAERNKVRAAYNHAQYLPERRMMMQAWADFVDAKASNARVVSMRRRA